MCSSSTSLITHFLSFSICIIRWLICTNRDFLSFPFIWCLLPSLDSPPPSLYWIQVWWMLCFPWVNRTIVSLCLTSEREYERNVVSLSNGNKELPQAISNGKVYRQLHLLPHTHTPVQDRISLTAYLGNVLGEESSLVLLIIEDNPFFGWREKNWEKIFRTH